MTEKEILRELLEKAADNLQIFTATKDLAEEIYRVLTDTEDTKVNTGGFIDILFDGPPDNESGRFVEVEDQNGRSTNAGEWIKRDDGLWALRISRLPTIDTEDTGVKEENNHSVFQDYLYHVKPRDRTLSDAFNAGLGAKQEHCIWRILEHGRYSSECHGELTGERDIEPSGNCPICGLPIQIKEQSE